MSLIFKQEPVPLAAWAFSSWWLVSSLAGWPQLCAIHGRRGGRQLFLHHGGAGSTRKRLPQGFHPVAAELIISSQRRKKSERYICIETSLIWQVQNYSSIYVLWIILISSSAVPVFHFIFIPSLHWQSLAFRKHLKQISVRDLGSHSTWSLLCHSVSTEFFLMCTLVFSTIWLQHAFKMNVTVGE